MPDDQMRRHAQQHQGYRGARSWLRSSLRAREKVADRRIDQDRQGQLSDAPQIANASEAVQLGRVFIELINAPFLNAGGTPNLSDPDDVVDFERLIELAEPLGPIGSSAPTALIQRQFQLAQ